ncbi:MAG: hypothetical protein E6G94_15640 [Alphaproteobacteria bacterium]|nr:MAG: hypothetical protein E6G94_15640 [Alphaproteobacteria bacterium]
MHSLAALIRNPRRASPGGCRHMCAALLLLIAATIPLTPAAAQITAYAPGEGNPNNIQLPIDVIASVGGRCGFAVSGAPSGSFDQRNFDVTGFTHDFLFSLNCTGPARVGVVSSNGGLKTSGAVPAGYSAVAPYNVSLHLVSNTAAVADGTCAVATLIAGTGTCAAFLGPASSTQGLRISAPSTNQTGSYLRVVAAAYNQVTGPTLVAGEYADTLTITLSAAP